MTKEPVEEVQFGLLPALATDGSVTLEVVDDGRGFEPGALDGPGHGLANVRERAERLGGELIVESAPGRGTRLALTIPVPAMGMA